VVSVLLQSPKLADCKLIPLSGAQLVNIDESLALSGTPGDVPERRRIEIRLRKSSSHEASRRSLHQFPYLCGSDVNVLNPNPALPSAPGNSGALLNIIRDR
jgi:hypothetical protein